MNRGNEKSRPLTRLKIGRLWAAFSLFWALVSSSHAYPQKLPNPANLHLRCVIFILRSLIFSICGYCFWLLLFFCFVCKNPALQCGIFVCIFFVNASCVSTSPMIQTHIDAPHLYEYLHELHVITFYQSTNSVLCFWWCLIHYVVIIVGVVGTQKWISNFDSE